MWRRQEDDWGSYFYNCCLQRTRTTGSFIKKVPLSALKHPRVSLRKRKDLISGSILYSSPLPSIKV